MRITEALLRKIIRETILKEIDIEDVGESCWAAGSTHDLMTCTIGKDRYYLKFSNPRMFYTGENPSLQILNEYLSYMIYRLFPAASIPSGIELVFDKKGSRVGLATSAVTRGNYMPPKRLAKLLSAGVYVDILLANWDISNNANVVVSPEGDRATRIDLGGNLDFRAQGRRKGNMFGDRAGELETMHPGSSKRITNVFDGADLREAADTFMSVTWGEISSRISEVREQVGLDLEKRGMDDLLEKWYEYVDHIAPIMSKRHAEVRAHAERMLRT